jgi:carbonic anhydrase/acetyltransferase-like protein (isoleucine patch superfamily)
MPIYELDGAGPELPASGRFWIAPDAVLIGKVRLEEGASVWFGAVLRGDNEPITVGERTNIQDGCILHTDPGYPLVIGRGCTVGHNAIVHGCTIGESCLIGMGATLMNGSKVGARSVVGANALVAERKEFGERALIVGAPARSVRTIDDAMLVHVERASELYFSRWQKYAGRLKRID